MTKEQEERIKYLEHELDDKIQRIVVLRFVVDGYKRAHDAVWGLFE